ncbi:MAG: YjjG family noncanonical pyrimidine nucleotidase [Clostridia bacterium]|nr:YjjG family noncanonical pyrimidine nucleotidase [Clostridia bacterium]
MIKNILIDIDNTLLDFNESAKQSMEISFNKNGLSFSENVFPTFKKINDGLWLKIERGEMTRADLHDVRWNLIFDSLGIDFDGHILERDFLDNLFNCAVKVSGALEIVKYLAKKYNLYSASNAFYNQQINRLKISGLLPFFKDNFVSEKIGFSKPKKEFFDECFKKMKGAKKEDTIMIGDSLSADVIGGKNYGLDTVWFNREKLNIENSQADFVVNSLSEIKNIL